MEHVRARDILLMDRKVGEGGRMKYAWVEV